MTARRFGVALIACSLLSIWNVGARAEELPKPREGCTADFSDTKDDAEYSPASNTEGVPESKLDITDVFTGTKGRTAFFYFKMPNYPADHKTAGFGPRWDMQFDVAGTTGKTIKIVHGVPDSNYKAVSGDTGPFTVVAMGNNVVQDGAKVTASVDPTTKFLLIAIDLDDLATRTAGSTATGAKLEKIAVFARILTSSISTKKSGDNRNYWNSDGTDFDRVPNSNALVLPYTVGDNKCFAPPKSKISALTGATVQYGDIANLSAKLTNEAGDAPVAGKVLTFAIAGKTATGTTGADGVAKVALAHGKTAGNYPMTVSFAGDDSWETSELAAPLVVKPETTKIVTPFKIAKSGTTRTVTVTVLDDDKKPVAGQYVNWWVNGRRVTAKKTATNGTATFTATAGQTVYAEVPTVIGKYLPTKTAATRLA